jgi:hypothetical protein
MRKKNCDRSLLFTIYLEFCEYKFLVYQRHLHFEHLMIHGNPILQKPCLLGNVLVNLLLHNQNFKLIMQWQWTLSFENMFFFYSSSIR